MLRVLAALVLFASLTLDTAPLRAQDTPSAADDREARGLFDAGREAFAAARYERALEYFRQSYALSHRPALLYNIAQSADRLRRDRDALEGFEAYLREVPEARERPAVEERIAFLRAALAREQGDGSAQNPATTGDSVGAGGDAPAPTGEPEEPRASGPGPLPWVLTIGGGALAVGGVVSLLLASSNAADVRDAEPGTPWTELESSYDASGTLGWLGGGLLVGGALLAGLGVVLLLTAGGGDDDEAARAQKTPPLRLTVLPTGVMLSGGWL